MTAVAKEGEAQATQLREEIRETEQQVKGFRQQLEEYYKKQRDLVNQRTKLKQSFGEADLSSANAEMLRLLFRQHTLTQQTLDYEHKSSQQEVMLKIKEAQTYSLSEQVKLRDEVIAKARNALQQSSRL